MVRAVAKADAMLTLSSAL